MTLSPTTEATCRNRNRERAKHRQRRRLRRLPPLLAAAARLASLSISFQAAPNVRLQRTCHFCACRARRRNSQCLTKSSPYAGPSAGTEVARLRKWYVWCLLVITISAAAVWGPPNAPRRPSPCPARAPRKCASKGVGRRGLVLKQTNGLQRIATCPGEVATLVTPSKLKALDSHPHKQIR